MSKPLQTLTTYIICWCMLIGFANAQRNPKIAEQETMEKELLLDAAVPLKFEPSNAFFIVTNGSRTMRIEAEFIPSFIPDSVQGAGEVWFGAARLDPERWKNGFSAVLVFADQSGQIAVGQSRAFRADAPEFFNGSLDLLKEFVKQRKEYLQGVDQLADLRAASRSRLERDAIVIGDIGKIADLEEERTQLKQQLSDLDLDLANLKNLIASAHSDSNPRSFVRRERELTGALRDLAGITREVEGAEGMRTATLQDELRRNEHLIEATRYEDIEDLKAELDRVRSRRVRLEGR